MSTANLTDIYHLNCASTSIFEDNYMLLSVSIIVIGVSLYYLYKNYRVAKKTDEQTANKLVQELQQNKTYQESETRYIKTRAAKLLEANRLNLTNSRDQ